MPVPHRPRRPLPAALTALFSLLLLGACYGPSHPNSIFTPFTEFNRDVGRLFDILIGFGLFVFVFVEALLIYTIWRYRSRPGQAMPEQVHGNTRLEILWTVIPTVILVFIAVPTVQTIFRTQAKAKSGALQVEVIGHQWWWEFRYPEYTTAGANGRLDTLVTANELYLPIGRTVNFTLRTNNVLHSFWVPALGGKRDLITNHTNYLWFTPDSSGEGAWVGNCTEYCGASHANMKLRAYTVTAEDFESWARHQLSPSIGSAPSPPRPVHRPSARRGRPQCPRAGSVRCRR
jgi:cytochrome c oxidase subunit 2